jgi:DNA-directed RNA polymerase subunit K/omega
MSEADAREDVLTEEASGERPKAPPIESRFLFVDVAALRAKQLRRGARPRLDDLADEPGPQAFKAERTAMDEVRFGLVDWQLPEFKVVVDNR